MNPSAAPLTSNYEQDTVPSNATFRCIPPAILPWIRLPKGGLSFFWGARGLQPGDLHN